MTRRRIPAAALIAPLIAWGCSGPPATGVVSPDPRPEVYGPVHRAAVELTSAQEIGMDRRRFGELLQKLDAELRLAGDRAGSVKERRVIDGYGGLLRIYKDSASIWDVRIKIPELKALADERVRIEAATGSTDPIMRNYGFQMAVIEGIPLNFYPNESTGIDGLVARYGLPIKDSDGWKTIPKDSVERVWSTARAAAEEVMRMQKE